MGTGIAWLIRKKAEGSNPKGDDPLHLYQATLIFFILWIFTIHGFTHLLRDWKLLNYIFLTGTCGLFYFVVPFKKENGFARGKTWALGKIRIPQWLPLYGAVFLLISYLVIDPFFPYTRYHYTYYLGPLADLLNGKSLLANINAQYGVLVFYFLGAIFHLLPLGYTSFAWVITLLIAAQYCVFYFFVRRLFRSGLYSFLCLLALLLVNHFAQNPRPTGAPSAGPLRFGFIYILMALVLLRNQYLARRNLILWLESLVMGVAFFWSYEVCFYTLPPYLAFTLFDTARFGKQLGVDGKALGGRILMLGTCVLLVGGALYTDVFLRTGGLPHWSYYLDYIFLYKGGFGSLDRPSMDYWCLIAGTLYFSLFALFAITLNRKDGKPLPENFNVVALATFYGIFQFLYFVYRAHPNNLFHVSMPSILLFAYWLNYLRSQTPSFVPAAARKIIFGLAVVFIGIYLQVLLPTAIAKIKEQTTTLPEFWNRILEASRDLPRDDQFALEAGDLMQKYSRDKKYLPYFFGEKATGDEVDYGFEVSMYAHRSKVYPYNDLSQADICPPAVQRVMDFNPGLQKGDYLYYRPPSPLDTEDGTEDKIHFEKDLVAGLFKRYDLKLVERKNEIEVYQVQGPLKE